MDAEYHFECLGARTLPPPAMQVVVYHSVLLVKTKKPEGERGRERGGGREGEGRRGREGEKERERERARERKRGERGRSEERREM